MGKTKSIIKVEDFIKLDKRKKYLKKVSKTAMSINFGSIFKNASFNDLEIFVLKPKQAYYNNTDKYFPYVDYFIEYFDDDDELLKGYLEMKYLIDRGDITKYPKNSFINDLFEIMLTESMQEKIKEMVDYNYSITLSTKNNFKYEAIEFTDEHGKILLYTSTALKIVIPIITHYLHVTKVGTKNDPFLYKIFRKIMELFQGDNFMYNKLVEFVSSKLTGKKSSDKAHWEKVQILGSDVSIETEKIVMRIIVDIIYKYNFTDNIVNLNTVSIRLNISWLFRENFGRNLKQISDIKDEEGLSEADKIEMNLSKFDESIVIMSGINIKQTINKLKKKYNIKFRDDEVAYYVNNIEISKVQKDIMFNLFGKYFGNIRDMYGLTIEQYAQLIIIMKEMTRLHGCKIIQHIISGKLTYNPHMKKMPKKQIQQIINSDKYHELKDKYKNTFDIISNDDALFKMINLLISCNVKLVDYDAFNSRGAELDIENNTNLIIDEYLKILIMV